jgi:hypothetical protein
MLAGVIDHEDERDRIWLALGQRKERERGESGGSFWLKRAVGRDCTTEIREGNEIENGEVRGHTER